MACPATFVRATPRSAISGCITSKAGEGPLLVLLHGFPRVLARLAAQIGPLAAAGFRVAAPDTRGYNLSSRPKGVAAYDTGLLAADLRGLIQERRAETAMLA